MLPKGHEVATGQFALPVTRRSSGSSGLTACSFSELSTDDMLEMSSGIFVVGFERRSGWLSHLRAGESDLLLQPLRPNFWRAPTDNDLGNGMNEWAALWQTASGRLVLDNFSVQKKDKARVVNTKYLSPDFQGALEFSYTLRCDGTIRVDYALTLSPDSGLPDLPRLGMQAVLSGDLWNLEWFGRGPHESYADRKTSALISRYSTDVRAQEHHYIRPQENSNRTDVRWLALTDEQGGGLLVVGDTPLSVSAWPYLQSDIDFTSGDGSESASGLVPVTTKHAIDVPIRDLVTVNIDHRQMGVGGDTSWGRPVHPPYRIQPGNYRYSFTLVPLIPGSEPAGKARVIRTKE